MFAAQKLHKRTMDELRAILETDSGNGQLYRNEMLKLLFISPTAFGLAYFDQGMFIACSLVFVKKNINCAKLWTKDEPAKDIANALLAEFGGYRAAVFSWRPTGSPSQNIF